MQLSPVAQSQSKRQALGKPPAAVHPSVAVGAQLLPPSRGMPGSGSTVAPSSDVTACSTEATTAYLECDENEEGLDEEEGGEAMYGEDMAVASGSLLQALAPAGPVPADAMLQSQCECDPVFCVLASFGHDAYPACCTTRHPLSCLIQR